MTCNDIESMTRKIREDARINEEWKLIGMSGMVVVSAPRQLDTSSEVWRTAVWSSMPPM
jgi:hypothetical protein